PSRHAPVCYLVLTDTATPDPFPLALHDALPISLDATDEEPSMPSPTSTPEERSFDRELRELLEHAIAELPVEFRTVFVLRAVEQMPAIDVAECLDIPVQTVKTRFRSEERRVGKEGRSGGSQE